MWETSGRLLRMLSLLQSGRDWTGAELADRLGVSPRTVRADVERLRRLGYPILATRGAVGGYRLGAGAAMPPLLLDDEEAVAVAIGLRAAAGGSIAGIEETALRALAKLEQVLPTRLRSRVTALASHTVRVPHDNPGPTVDPAVLTTLVGLCRDRMRFRFQYQNHSGGTGVRVAEPYKVVNWGRRWYLVAWDVERHDWRTYRVDRIEPLPPFGPRFAPREPPEADLAAYVSRRVSAAAWRYRSRVVVHAPARVVAERINPAVGTVEVIDEHNCVLHTGADTVATLAVYLSLLGADFTVTEPAELVEYLGTLARRYQGAVSAG